MDTNASSNPVVAQMAPAPPVPPPPPPVAKTAGPPHHSGAGLIRLIGAFKLFKGIVLLVAGIAALSVVSGNVGQIGETANQWVRDFNFDPENRHIRAVLAMLTGLTPRRLHELGIGAFIYSILFFTEGVGLLLVKRWAEWVAVISTAGFIPLEIYELIRRHTWVRAGLLVINTTIVIYLIWRIRRDDREIAAAQALASVPAFTPTQTEPGH